ncbi:MAG: pentapeptide repeat-containing protein, partial [Bacteroidota bacterium]
PISAKEKLKNKEVDLKGIIFPNGKYEQLWTAKTYSYPLNFNACVFHCSIHIRGSEFKTIDFSDAIFKHRFFCKDTQFRQLVYSKGATFENGLHFDNCQFSNNVFFDECTFNNEQKHPSIDFSIKHSVFKRPLDFSGTVFNLAFSLSDVTLDGADFSDAVFHEECFIDKASFSKTILFQRTEFLYTENFGGHMSAVDIKNIQLEASSKIVFRGKEAFYDQVKGEIYLAITEESTGTILIENFNLNKFENTAKAKLLDLEKAGQVEIGKGCRKYRHQTLPRRIDIQQSNQSLVTELTHTFVSFFKNENGLNLGVEVVGRSEDYIEIIYFSDEKISSEAFEERLNKTGQEMWALVKVNTGSVQVSPSKETLPDKIIGTTDTLINLAALMLKISTRIPMLKIGKNELSQLIQSTTFGATPNIDESAFSVLNVNQTILLGIGNSQEIKL